MGKTLLRFRGAWWKKQEPAQLTRVRVRWVAIKIPLSAPSPARPPSELAAVFWEDGYQKRQRSCLIGD